MRLPPGRQFISCLLLVCSTAAAAQLAAPAERTHIERPLAFTEPVMLRGYAGGIAVEWSGASQAPVAYYAVHRVVGDQDQVVATFSPQANGAEPAHYRFIDQGDADPGLAFRVSAAYTDGRIASTEPIVAAGAYRQSARMHAALDRETLTHLHLQLDSGVRREVMLRVATLAGDAVANYRRELRTGTNDLQLDYSEWVAGYYSVSLSGHPEAVEWLVHVDPLQRVATARLMASDGKG